MTTLLLMAPQAVSDNQVIIVMMFKFLCIIIILSGMLSQLPSSLPPVAHPEFMLSTPEYVWPSGKYIKAGTKWPIFGRQHLKCIFLNKNCFILIKILLKFVHMGQIANKSPLVQVLVWYHHAPNQYLDQCWPKSMMPHDITRPQWVKGATWQKPMGPLKTVASCGVSESTWDHTSPLSSHNEDWLTTVCN